MHKDVGPFEGALGLCRGPPTRRLRRVINGARGTPGEVPLRERVVPLIWAISIMVNASGS